MFWMLLTAAAAASSNPELDRMTEAEFCAEISQRAENTPLKIEGVTHVQGLAADCASKVVRSIVKVAAPFAGSDAYIREMQRRSNGMTCGQPEFVSLSRRAWRYQYELTFEGGEKVTVEISCPT